MNGNLEIGQQLPCRNALYISGTDQIRPCLASAVRTRMTVSSERLKKASSREVLVLEPTRFAMTDQLPDLGLEKNLLIRDSEPPDALSVADA